MITKHLYCTIKEKKCFVYNNENCWSINHNRKNWNIFKTQLRNCFNACFQRFIHQSNENWKQRVFQYIINYVVDHKDMNLNLNNFVDKIRAFIMNITISAFKSFEFWSILSINQFYHVWSIDFFNYGYIGQ